MVEEREQTMVKIGNLMLVAALLVALAAAPAVQASEKGSADFRVADTLMVAGTEVSPGQYKVKYQSQSPEATVSFTKSGKESAKVQGKIVNVDKKYDYNSLVIGKDDSGRPVLHAIEFAGKNYRIVFE